MKAALNALISTVSSSLVDGFLGVVVAMKLPRSDAPDTAGLKAGVVHVIEQLFHPNLRVLLGLHHLNVYLLLDGLVDLLGLLRSDQACIHDLIPEPSDRVPSLPLLLHLITGPAGDKCAKLILLHTETLSNL